MFSRTSEYAVRAVVMLAQLKSDGRVGASELAERAKVPPSYLPKLMQNLAKAGIVDSKRGVGGGFSLRKSPDEITILDIVNAVDPIHRIEGCPLGLESHSEVLCPVHARLDQAICEVETVLGKSTLAELLTDDTRPKPMLESLQFLGQLSRRSEKKTEDASQ